MPISGIFDSYVGAHSSQNYLRFVWLIRVLYVLAEYGHCWHPRPNRNNFTADRWLLFFGRENGRRVEVKKPWISMDSHRPYEAPLAMSLRNSSERTWPTRAEKSSLKYPPDRASRRFQGKRDLGNALHHCANPEDCKDSVPLVVTNNDRFCIRRTTTGSHELVEYKAKAQVMSGGAVTLSARSWSSFQPHVESLPQFTSGDKNCHYLLHAPDTALSARTCSRGGRLHRLCQVVRWFYLHTHGCSPFSHTQSQPFQTHVGSLRSAPQFTPGSKNCHYLCGVVAAGSTGYARWKQWSYLHTGAALLAVLKFNPFSRAWSRGGPASQAMSNGGIAIISGIQPFQPLVGSRRPAPQAYVGWYRNYPYLWQAHRHRTFSRTCAGFTEWFRNCHFFFLAWTQIQHCQPHAGSWPCAQAPMMESCSFFY